MRINFGIEAYKERSIDLNAQECINFFPVPGGPAGKAEWALYGTPGYMLFGNIPSSGIRGSHVLGNTLYVVADGTLFSVNTGGAETALGTLDTLSGRVIFADNGTQIMLVDGTSGYTYNTSTATFAKITDADFPASPECVTFIGGYFVVTIDNSRRFYISALYDGTSWGANDYASAESLPDNLLACISDHGELWLPGEESTEVFAVTGAAFPFVKISSSIIEWGIAAQYSLAKAGNSLLWLARPPGGGSPQVVIVQGYNPTPISTPALDREFASYSLTADAFAYSYNEEGHQFYVLTFPNAGKTWCLNLTTGKWHQRRSGTGRHRSNCYAYFNGKHIIGDYENGNLYDMSMDYYDENGTRIPRIVTSPVIFDQDNKRIFHHSLQLDFEGGTGTATIDPAVALTWSNDGGHTYGNEHLRTTGYIGEYGKRAKWDLLGESRERIYKVTVDAPVKWVLIAANLEATVGTA